MLLICMSISGTIPLLICLGLWLLLKESFSFRLGKGLLLISMVFYLLPVQLIKYLFPKRVVAFIESSVNGGYYMDIQHSISLHFGRQSLWIPRHYLYLAAGWLMVILCFCVYQIIKYNRQIRILKEASREKMVDIPSVGKRTILVTEFVSAPYTVGFLHVFIIFPEHLLDNACAGMILKHEYAHLVNRDSLFKLICLVIICLHWFNPLAILLLILYGIFSEFIADEAATAKCTKEEKKDYINMMIELSSESAGMPIIWKNGFFSGKDILKRRMDYIMKKNTVSRFKKILAACITCVTIIASSSTIMAYSPLLTTTEEINGTFNTEFLEYGDMDNSASIDFSTSNIVFITKDNTQIPTQNNVVSPYALICIHSFIDGTVSTHNSNSSGGCTVTVYNARRCEKCGHLDIKEKIKTITYVTCPHK